MNENLMVLPQLRKNMEMHVDDIEIHVCGKNGE